MASQLKSFIFKAFDGGYDSFSGSRSNVKDNEIPALPGVTQNVMLDDNGSPEKRPGSALFSGQMTVGHAVTGMKDFLKSSGNSVIAANNTSWWNCSAGTATQIPGVTFTADQKTFFTEASGYVIGGNGTDNLAYTDGNTVTSISTNGVLGGTSPVYYNNRIYVLGPTGDRVYYSNPVRISNLSSNGSVTSQSVVSPFDFSNLFNTDLTQTPKLNAGFLVFNYGSGSSLKRLYVDGDQLWVYDQYQGFSTITPNPTVNADGTIIHNVSKAVVGAQFPSPNALQKIQQNDQYFFGGDNIYSRGEVQYYISARVTTQSGRVQSEMRSVTASGRNDVALGFFQNKVFVAYRTSGSINNTVIIQDRVLNAWSTPWFGINANSFLSFTDSAGAQHLLAASSDPQSPYLVELMVGNNDINGLPIVAAFETKSSDLGSPGLVKYGAFIDVFYQFLSGSIDCTVIGDETNELASLTQGQQIVASGSYGVGSQVAGTFLVGAEYTPGSIVAASQYEGKFRITVGYKPFQRLSIRFSNPRPGEQFKINSVAVWYKPGSIYQQ